MLKRQKRRGLVDRVLGLAVGVKVLAAAAALVVLALVLLLFRKLPNTTGLSFSWEVSITPFVPAVGAKPLFLAERLATSSGHFVFFFFCLWWVLSRYY